MTPSRLRFPAMGLAIIALLVGMSGGLARLGVVTAPVAFGVYHGPLMVSGFLGTLIALERAVALGRRWGYAGPALTGIGSMALVAGLPKIVGAGLFVVGSLGSVTVFVIYLRRHGSAPMWVMTAGAICWAVGNIAWALNVGLFRVVPVWMAYLSLTIVGERLELTRFRIRRTRQTIPFWIATAIVITSLVAMVIAHDIGVRALGVGFVVWALWLFRYDMALRSLRKPGVHRFAAVALLIAHFWLGVSGALMIAFGGWAGVLKYDTILHSFFLGFVVSMIFGHAPVVFPAVLGIRVPFHRWHYAPLALLHVSLVVRLLGDLLIWMPGRDYGSVANVAAILLFLGVTIGSMARALPTGDLRETIT